MHNFLVKKRRRIIPYLNVLVRLTLLDLMYFKALSALRTRLRKSRLNLHQMLYQLGFFLLMCKFIQKLLFHFSVLRIIFV